jgi:hypothetical protein
MDQTGTKQRSSARKLGVPSGACGWLLGVHETDSRALAQAPRMTARGVAVLLAVR